MKISQQYILVKYLFSNFLCLKLYYDVVVELFILFKIVKIIIILPKVKKQNEKASKNKMERLTKIEIY